MKVTDQESMLVKEKEDKEKNAIAFKQILHTITTGSTNSSMATLHQNRDSSNPALLSTSSNITTIPSKR